MSTTRKSLEQIRKDRGGKGDRTKLNRFTEGDIERMAREDREADWFPPDAKPAGDQNPVSL